MKPLVFLDINQMFTVVFRMKNI